eukprot:TRINITY_DN3928_c0_g1_i5.p1 TRINITY_DN3928_c0_g1~~TRINITY_DN3928_c0_g1_i5.p1  ORF type:complete len:251 (+),score=57.68 TRINITY_DN3928_c0_g1_i5:192-944(+)
MSPHAEAYSSGSSEDVHCMPVMKPMSSRRQAWNGHLKRLYVLNFFTVAVFAVSMYSFLKEWEGALNRMNVFKLALPGLGVFASMTYFFGFFGISFVNSVLGTDNQAEPCELDTDEPNNSSSDAASAAVASGPYARCAPPSSAKYTLEQPEVVVIGAGTAGASLAIAFARQGRRVTLIEKSFVLQDRIVGELMQPGGMRALETLGLAACATERCDSVRVDGYTVIPPPRPRRHHQRPRQRAVRRVHDTRLQ